MSSRHRETEINGLDHLLVSVESALIYPPEAIGVLLNPPTRRCRPGRWYVTDMTIRRIRPLTRNSGPIPAVVPCKAADQAVGPVPGDAGYAVWTLVERAQDGDAEAFGQIYDRYFDMVFRFTYFRTGSRQLAEDLTADTFLRALKRIGSFTWQGRDLGAWLVTIARNLVADHYKSGKYRLEAATDDLALMGAADATDSRVGWHRSDPETAVVDHFSNVALLKAVKQLNPEQQDCIVLRFLQGFSVTETALAMDKNEGAIKALQYRAVRTLRRLLPAGFALPT